MLYTDLTELKKVLEVHPLDTVEDAKLSLFAAWASSMIEEFLGRPDFSYAVRTEYYNGTGTQKLLLRHRPVRTSPAIQVYVDEAGYYGAPEGSFDATLTALTYGTDFALQLREEGKPSRTGILVRLRNLWPEPAVRQPGLLSPFLGDPFGNIKVVYGGGYLLDDLPPVFRAACNLLVARLRYLFPLGMELNSDSFEDKSIGIAGERKDYLMSLIKPMLFNYRNWRF